MKTWLGSKTVLCGLVLVLGACGGDDESGSNSSSLTGCSDMCAKIEPLACPGDMPGGCQAECDSVDDQAPNCHAQAQAYVTCAAARPATEFTCIDGEGDLPETVCTAERNALTSCFLGGLAGMNGGGTGGGGAGTGSEPATCEFTNDGECDEPIFCPVGTDTADCGG